MSKFYGVKSGRSIGVFKTWGECQESVKGYSGAEFKKFKTFEEAKSYVTGEPIEPKQVNIEPKEELITHKEINNMEELLESIEPKVDIDKIETIAPIDTIEDVFLNTSNVFDIISVLKDKEAVCYVDGSYEPSTKNFSWGAVFIDNSSLNEYKDMYDKNSKSFKYSKHRNVAGELLGAMFAISKAKELGKKKLYLCYDYEGIEKWSTGEWKANHELTKTYKLFVEKFSKDISVHFVKIKGHSNNLLNDRADLLAKQALGLA